MQTHGCMISCKWIEGNQVQKEVLTFSLQWNWDSPENEEHTCNKHEMMAVSMRKPSSVTSCMGRIISLKLSISCLTYYLQWNWDSPEVDKQRGLSKKCNETRNDGKFFVDKPERGWRQLAGSLQYSDLKLSILIFCRGFFFFFNLLAIINEKRIEKWQDL